MQIQTIGAARTMSSREIAELTEKNHADVLRDTRNMLDQLGERHSSFAGTYPVPGPNGAKRSAPCFNLPKDLTITLVAGYSVVLRHRIVQRWQELEAAAAPVRELSRLEILQLAMESEQARIRAEQALAIAEPKAAALDRLAGADGTMCVTNAAKALKVPPRKLFVWLSAERWIYKRAGSAAWTAYQDRIQSGLLQHKTTTVERGDGSDKVVDQVLVTAKGLAKLAKAFGAEGGAA